MKQALVSVADLWHVFRSPYSGERTLRRLQEKRLRYVVAHAARHVPYYRTLFDAHGLDPASIRSLDDLQRIPVTTKSDLLAAGSDAISTAIAAEKCT